MLFFMLINVKMLNSWVEHEKNYIISGPGVFVFSWELHLTLKMLKIKIVDFVSRVDTDEDTQSEPPHVGLHIFPSFLK